MYKKRLKKWSIRKRTYRKAQASTPASVSTPSAPTPDSSLSVSQAEDYGDPDVEEIPRTPDASERAVTLAQPSIPECYAGLEIVLGSVFSWSQGKIETHGIISDPMSMYLANPNQPPIQDSRTMYRTFELVFDLWRHGKGNLAGMAARKGFYVLEYVLTDDHPDVVWHILDTIYDMVDKGHIQLLSMFIDHATILAHRQLPAQHPLTLILTQFRKCDYQSDQGREYLRHLLRQAWARNVGVLGSEIGSMAPRHFWLYEQLIWDGRTRLRKNSDLKQMRDSMLPALQDLATHRDPNAEDPNSERLRVEALMLEFTQMDLGDKEKAEQLALQLLNHTTSTGDPTNRSNARFHAYARKMLARLYEDRFDWATAEQNLKWAINKRETAHGTNNNLRVVRDMWVLAGHFRRTGRVVEAEMVVEDAINRATQYLEDIPG